MIDNNSVYFKEQTGYTIDFCMTKIRPKLIYYLFKYTKDSMVSEDIADEALISSFFNISKFDKDKSQYETWLFHCAKNLVLSYLNKHKNKKYSSFNDEDNESLDIIEKVSYDSYKDSINNVEDISDIDTLSRVKFVKKTILDMKPIFASSLIMREIDGLTYKDISDILEVNINTIKSRIKKARSILVEKMNEEFKIQHNNKFNFNEMIKF